MAGPAPTTLTNHKDRSAEPVHSSGWLFRPRLFANSVQQFVDVPHFLRIRWISEVIMSPVLEEQTGSEIGKRFAISSMVRYVCTLCKPTHLHIAIKCLCKPHDPRPVR